MNEHYFLLEDSLNSLQHALLLNLSLIHIFTNNKMENKITTMEQGMQRRTELLLVKDNLEKIQKARVLIFGIGGVGSWLRIPCRCLRL